MNLPDPHKAHQAVVQLAGQPRTRAPLPGLLPTRQPRWFEHNGDNEMVSPNVPELCSCKLELKQHSALAPRAGVPASPLEISLRSRQDFFCAAYMASPFTMA